MNNIGHFLSRLTVLTLGLIILGAVFIGGLYLGYLGIRTISTQLFFGLLYIFASIFPLFFAGIILLEIFSDFKKLFAPKKCLLCSKTAYDTLTGDKNIGEFCRQHLIEKYSQYFKTSHFNVVMVEYQPKGLSSPSYYYYPVSDIDFRSRYSSKDDVEAQDTIRHLLDVIKTKKCERCSKQASILFVSKEVSPFSKYQTTPRKEFEQKGNYFCKDHAMEKIIPAIQNSTKHFDTYEGLCLSRKEDGYQATVEF